MQAWNIYLVVLLAHNPSRAELFGYQRLICSANTLLPVHSWLQYDSKFRTLAAADPLLRWDQRHPDLWLECLASGQQNKRWPCPYCRATNHFPSNCPHAPFRYKKKIHQSTEHQTTDLEHQIAAEHIIVQSVVCLIKDTAPVKTVLPCITPYTHAPVHACSLAINDKHNVQLFFVALVLVLL